MSSTDPLLKLKDIMAELRVSHETARRLVLDSGVPYIKAGKSYRVRRSDFERVLLGGAATPAAAATAGAIGPNPMRPGAGLDSGFQQ